MSKYSVTVGELKEIMKNVLPHAKNLPFVCYIVSCEYRRMFPLSTLTGIDTNLRQSFDRIMTQSFNMVFKAPQLDVFVSLMLNDDNYRKARDNNFHRQKYVSLMLKELESFEDDIPASLVLVKVLKRVKKRYTKFIMKKYGEKVEVVEPDDNITKIAKAVEAIDPEAAKWILVNRDNMPKAATTLISMFYWGGSPQGHDFWESLQCRIGTIITD